MKVKIAGLIAVALVIVGALTYIVFKNIQTRLPTKEAEPAGLEGKTSVSDKAIAAKVDYARKIIVIKDEGQRAAFEQAVKTAGGEIIGQIDSTSFVVQLDKNKVGEQTESLSKNESVAIVDTDYPVSVIADVIDWGVDRIAAPKVWDKTTGSGIRVAVLDTGIDVNHQDLRGTVAAAQNLIDNSTNVADGHGHGTHVSGTVTALKNEIGYLGASYQVNLLVGKVLADNGMGYISDVVEGINWAKNNGARVINLSLGTSYNSRILEDAVNSAAGSGVIVVAAGGNTGGPLLYPAAYSSVISVGATDGNNNLAGFSAVGATVVAPGVGITSTLPSNRYAAWSGTSMAAPHVSAAAALLIAQGETSVRTKLQESATDLGTPGRDGTYGYGLVNVDNAINIKDTTPPLITITEPTDQATVSGEVMFKASVTDESGVKEVIFKLADKELKRFTSEPYELKFDTRGLADGDYTFYVTATDQKDNTATVRILLKIDNSKETEPGSPPGGDEPGRRDISPENPSREHRQDIAPDNPSQEVRRDIGKPPEKDIPNGTNYGHRGRSEGKRNR